MRRALLFILVAFAAVPQAAPAAVGEFRGFVTNVENGLPVAGAVVSAGGRVALSGADGAYRLPAAMGGRFVVRAEAAPYHEAEKTAEMAGGRVDLNFELTPRRPEGRVFGTVYDAALLRPIEKAEVSLDGVAMRTGPSGQFVFDPVEAGDRWLSVAAAGYKVAAKRLRVDARNEQAVVYLTPDVEFAELSGVCLDRATSRPVPLAVVRLGDDRAVSDADGRFALPPRMPGAARLLVTRDRYWRQEFTLDPKPGRTNLVVHLEPRDAAEILDAMRRNVRDRARVESVTEGPAAAGARSLAVETRTLPMAERRREIERILGADTARPTERFIRGEVRLAPDGEYAGFIAFLYDEAGKSTRNVSLRAAANSRAVLLTRAAYRFRPVAGGVVVHLDVDGWSGDALLREQGRFAEFTVLLEPPAERLAGPVDALAPAACAPAHPGKPGLDAPPPEPRHAPPAADSAMKNARGPEPPSPAPAPAQETEPDPRSGPPAEGAPRAEFGADAWTSDLAGTLRAKGMDLPLARDTRYGNVAGASVRGGYRLSAAHRFDTEYSRFTHDGPLAATATFDGRTYTPGAALETTNEHLDLTLSQRIAEEAATLLRLDLGVAFDRSRTTLEQTTPAGRNAGHLGSSFGTPFVGVTGLSRLSPHLTLEAKGKAGAWSRGDTRSRLSDATLAFLIGIDSLDASADPEWFGTLGYRYLIFRGDQGGDRVKFDLSGPVIGLRGRI